MIVTCERCNTRFQLADVRVPEGGARVRCSRCKHAFLVLPPGGSAEQTIHAVAGAAVLAEAPTLPSVSVDLPAPAPLLAEDDAEWQFAEPPEPALVRGPGSESATNPWEGVLEEEKPPEARELDTLGSPESWSFVSEEAPPLQAPRPAASARPTPAAQSLGNAVPIGRLRAPKPAATESVSDLVVLPPSRVFERVGWTLTALLLLAIVHGIAWSGSAPAVVARSLPLGDGLVVEDLSLRRLENLVSGQVLVVSGTVVNPGPVQAGRASQLKVRVVGPYGAAEADAMAPRTSQALREAPPEAARREAAALLTAPLAAGGRIPFEAVVEKPPQGDALLEQRLEPAPAEAVVSGSSEEGKATLPATGGPFLPPPLPSSG